MGRAATSPTETRSDDMGEGVLSRRRFIATSGGAIGALGVVALAGMPAAAAEVDSAPYGPLGAPDANGIRLPDGFTSRVLARSGTAVEGTDYEWHVFPDGGATFPLDDGGWVYVSNSELLSSSDGGAGALRFDADGEVADAYRILGGTLGNCAGGPTPWGTWLSCEENENGQVWECDPSGERDAVVRPALGTFNHEAVTVDPEQRVLYLTEDKPDGRLYRFTPIVYPSLEGGTLEVARVNGSAVDWLEVPDPAATSAPTRTQVPDSTAFAGGEGIWYADGVVHFSTKGTGQIWRFDPGEQTIEVLYDPPTGEGAEPVLDGVDNITVTAAGEVLVAEDHGGEQDIVVVGADGRAGRLLRVTGQPQSELTGPAMSPAGDRLYFSSQRGGPDNSGVTYEISGPFRAPKPAAATTTTTAVGGAAGALAEAAGSGDSDDGGGISTPVLVGGVGALLALGAAGAWRLRSRGESSDHTAG